MLPFRNLARGRFCFAYDRIAGRVVGRVKELRLSVNNNLVTIRDTRLAYGVHRLGGHSESTHHSGTRLARLALGMLWDVGTTRQHKDGGLR